MEYAGIVCKQTLSEYFPSFRLPGKNIMMNIKEIHTLGELKSSGLSLHPFGPRDVPAQRFGKNAVAVLYQNFTLHEISNKRYYFCFLAAKHVIALFNLIHLCSAVLRF